MTLALAMIVRDDEEALERCLPTVAPILDAWTILDTGSANIDALRQVAGAYLGHLPGGVFETEWQGFGKARTEALELADLSAEWALMIHADMTVELAGDLELPPADAGNVQVSEGGLVYSLPLLTRTGLPWEYVGVTHEHLACARVFSRGNVEGLSVVHHADGAGRGVKLARDLAALNASLGTGQMMRDTYYLAQTYRDLGNLRAAADLYGRRARMGGWDEEAWHARYQEGVCLILLGDHAGGEHALTDAWELRPGRAEPARYLARWFENAGKLRLSRLWHRVADLAVFPPGDDTLFIERAAYRQPDDVSSE